MKNEQQIRDWCEDWANSDREIDWLVDKISTVVDQAIVEERELLGQCWSGMIFLRDLLIKYGVDSPTVRGRDIQEIIDELVENMGK